MPPIIDGMATRTATLSLILPTAGAEIQLLPAGLFRAADGSGRPEGLPGWYIDAEIAGRIIAAASARATKYVIDYEHQTFLAEKNGQPAPAAGWFDGRGLVWREGQGLFATQVEWTERARIMIGDGEYRYLSPAFQWDDVTGHVKLLVNAGLTNNPGLDGMAAVALTAALNALYPPSEEDPPVNELLKQLLVALGLPADATEATALTAVAALKAKIDEVATLKSQVATLSAQAASATNPDPAKFVAVETMAALQAQVATLSAQVQTGEAAKVIDAAIDAGKLLPAQRQWAEDLGKKDIAALKAYVDVATPVAALAGMQTTTTTPPAGQPAKLTDSELAVCKSMGLSADEFLKNRGA